MKIKLIVCSALATALLNGCININLDGEGHDKKCEMCEHQKKEKDKKASQTELMAEAKISKETAQQTALAKVPNGAIKDGELEKEHGKLQWSFDVAMPNSKDITEVNVDAITGEVISMDKESAESEAKEGSKDKEKD